MAMSTQRSVSRYGTLPHAVAPQTLLHLQRQAVHAAARVRRPARDPDRHAYPEGNHALSSTGCRRAEATGSTDVGTITRRPFASTISIFESSDRNGAEEASAALLAPGKPICARCPN